MTEETKSHKSFGPETCNLDLSNQLPPGTKRKRTSIPKATSSDEDSTIENKKKAGNRSSKERKTKTPSPQYSTNTNLSSYYTEDGILVGWHRDDPGPSGLRIEAVMDVTGLDVTFLVAMKPNAVPPGYRDEIHRHLLGQLTENEDGIVDPRYVVLDPGLFFQFRAEYLEGLDSEEKKKLVLPLLVERNSDYFASRVSNDGL